MQSKTFQNILNRYCMPMGGFPFRGKYAREGQQVKLANCTSSRRTMSMSSYKEMSLDKK